MSWVYVFYGVAAAIGAVLVGLIGTGSSLVIMPTLVLSFPYVFPGYEVLRVATGTTMATMTVAAVAAATVRFRSGHIEGPLLRLMCFPYLFGALVGPWISRYIPTHLLRLYIATIVVVIALHMLFTRQGRAKRERDYRHHVVEICVVLFAIGLTSSVAGIASGIFATPYLTRFSLPMKTVIGTSTAGAALYSLFGTVGYVTAGWSATNLPDDTVGFVYIPAFLIMAVVVVVCAPMGVWLARYVNDVVLKRMFAVFLLVAAMAMVYV